MKHCTTKIIYFLIFSIFTGCQSTPSPLANHDGFLGSHKFKQEQFEQLNDEFLSVLKLLRENYYRKLEEDEILEKLRLSFEVANELFSLTKEQNVRIVDSLEKAQSSEALVKSYTIALDAVATFPEDESYDDVASKVMNPFLRQFDIRSKYLDEISYKNYKNRNEGEYVGVGMRVTNKDNVITVISPMKNSPAMAAGILAGDQIIAIDSHLTDGMEIDKAVKFILGEAGTKVRLTLRRKNVNEPIVVEIVRQEITFDSVESKRMGDILHLSVHAFTGNVAEEVEEILDNNKTWIKKVILDLRNNSGGKIRQCVKLVDFFIDRDVVLYTRGQGYHASYTLKTKYMRETDVPMVVLMNEGTASASEITIGALKAHKRATIMGTFSFGKGTAQRTFPLEGEETALTLTIAESILPDKSRFHGIGLKPDYFYKEDEPKEKEDGLLELARVFLNGNKEQFENMLNADENLLRLFDQPDMKDTESPVITIYGPKFKKNGIVKLNHDDEKVLVYGRAKDGVEFDRLLVNGLPVSLNEFGQFSFNWSKDRYGEELNITAFDTAGNHAERNLIFSNSILIQR